MPVLIPEILFAIGKQIIGNGDSENDVVKFAISGKESLKAARNVLYSVTTFKLYENEEFDVGWDGKCSKFIYKKLPTSLVYCIGGSVINLHIEKLINPFFQPIIDTIIEQKKLISFASGAFPSTCAVLVMKDILPQFSTTLKDLTFPAQFISGILFCELRPESLTLLNRGQLFKIFPCSENGIPLLSSVKNLYFDDGNNCSVFENFIIAYSPLLESLHFNMSYICSEASFAGILKYDVESFIRVIEKLKKFPTKIIYNVFIGRKLSKSGTIYELETNFCEDFVYDDFSNPEFHYFRQTFLSANSEEMLFEIRIPKMKD